MAATVRITAAQVNAGTRVRLTAARVFGGTPGGPNARVRLTAAGVVAPPASTCQVRLVAAGAFTRDAPTGLQLVTFDGVSWLNIPGQLVMFDGSNWNPA